MRKHPEKKVRAKSYTSNNIEVSLQTRIWLKSLNKVTFRLSSTIVPQRITMYERRIKSKAFEAN